MKRAVEATGDHGIGQMIHVVHVGEDVLRMRDFYENVLGGVTFLGVDEPNYLEVEDRDSCLILINDFVIEVMAPRMPADPRRPVGKFFTRFGQHLHSVGYKVEDLPGLGNRMIRKGIRIGKPGGGLLEEVADGTMYFFPSPKDTAGLMVEMCAFDMPNDPRDMDLWSSLARTWRAHPTTIERFGCVTLGVRDLDAAATTYTDVLQALPVGEGQDDDLGARYRTLQLGDCLLQLAEPLSTDSDLGRHVEQWGNMIHSLRFQVRDTDAAAAWFTTQGVRFTRPRPESLVTDPRDTFGAPLVFSTDAPTGR